MRSRSNRKVFVTNRGGHNYRDAERFGKLVFITEGSQNRFAASVLYRAAVDALKDSNPDDYILVTSMNVLNSIVSAVFSRMHGRLNLLLFRNGRYEARELDIDSLVDLAEVDQGEMDD